MPRVNFGTKDEPGFELKESADLIAVRTVNAQPVQGSGPVLLPPAAQVGDAVLVAEFPQAGVEVYKLPVSGTALEDRKRALRAAPAVRFAGSVLVQADSNEPVLYTENIYIRFREDLEPEDCEEIIRGAGLTVKEQMDFATNAYFAAGQEGIGQRVFDIAQQLLARPDVIYCHPELIRERRSKQIYPQQWHLKAATINGSIVNAHSNVEAAHGTALGAGVTIAIIDDGVAIDHEEFSGLGKVVAPRDASLQTDDPRPKFNYEMHGTACAGVACASGILGASGVAPSARLMPIRLSDGLGSVREAQAFRWAADHGADVISCSWGPADGNWWDLADPTHTQNSPLPASTRDAIDYAVTNGRGGKGCIILFAAGNGNESVEFDGYASYERVIAVAACSDRSKRSVYSDYGDAVLCCFPSSDFGHPPFNHPDALTPGIWTTDRPGSAGYNSGNTQLGDLAGKFTNDFGGTSSSCPGAAGVVALILSVNHQLRLDKVREIITKACDPIDPQGGEYNTQGHSKYYGFGRLNAETAVKLAKKNTGRLFVFNMLLNAPIPDLGRVDGSLEVSESGQAEKIAIYVRLKHSYIGDLVITAIPPAGQGMSPVILHNRAGGTRNSIDKVYDSSNLPQLTAYNGKKCHGKWTVRVEDLARQDSGVLEQIGIHISLPPANEDLLAASPVNQVSSTSPKKSPKKAKPKRLATPKKKVRKPKKAAKIRR